MNAVRPLHPMVERFLRFAVVGLFGTAAHYALLVSLVEVLEVSALLASTAGFVVGALINYTLNRRYTFVSNAEHATALPKFLSTATAGAMINWLVVALLLKHLGIYYVLAQLCATAIVLLWNFAVNSLWTFRT